MTEIYYKMCSVLSEMKKYKNHVKQCEIDNCVDCIYPNFLTRITIDNYVVYAHQKGICIEKNYLNIFHNYFSISHNICGMCKYYDTIDNKVFTLYGTVYKLCNECSILYKKISEHERQVINVEKYISVYIRSLNIPLDICNIINIYFGRYFT